MLTKPQHGWSDFSLEDTFSYGLSYLDDIGMEWVAQAIHGLETLNPFCVHGNLEPGRMLCIVSYWNCYIVVEDEDDINRRGRGKEQMIQEYSNTSMLDFCQQLYTDISGNIEEWGSFVDYHHEDWTEKQKKLAGLLEQLRELIAEKEKYFDTKFWFT